MSTLLAVSRSVSRSVSQSRASWLVKSIGLPLPFHQVTTSGGPSLDARTKNRSFFVVRLGLAQVLAAHLPRCSKSTLTNGVIQQMTFSPFSRKKVIISVRLANPGNAVPSNVPGWPNWVFSGSPAVKARGGDVELEVVVGDLPGRVEDERGDGDAPLPELGDGVADLAPVAPDVGRDPGPEREGGRQRGPAGEAGVAGQHVGQRGAVDDVEFQGPDVVGDDVAARDRRAHVEGALRRRVEVEPVAAGADEPRRDLVGPVPLVAGVVERQDVHDVPGLVQRVELLAEPVEVLVGVGGGGDRGLVRLRARSSR